MQTLLLTFQPLDGLLIHSCACRHTHTHTHPFCSPTDGMAAPPRRPIFHSSIQVGRQRLTPRHPSHPSDAGGDVRVRPPPPPPIPTACICDSTRCQPIYRSCDECPLHAFFRPSFSLRLLLSIFSLQQLIWNRNKSAVRWRRG